MYQSNIHIDGRTRGFPAEHCPKHQTASLFFPVVHPAVRCSTDKRCTCTWPSMWFIRSRHHLPWSSSPLLVLSVVNRGQHGRPDWSVALHTYRIKLDAVYSDIFPLEPALTILTIWAIIGSHYPVVRSPLLLILIDTDHCRLGTSHRSCSFGDVLYFHHSLVLVKFVQILMVVYFSCF